MTAALLDAHGVAAGASISPHLERWSERTIVRGAEIGAEEFAAAVERTAEAVAAVDRGLEEGEAVTQFEVATAASFLALASAHIDVAVIEAGLGGRLDATNTIPSRVTVLTSVGLDHTEWLGETEEEIAAEKLAVLRDATTLVLGRVSNPVRSLAERTARERGAGVIVAAEDPGEGIRLRARGPFQRRNFALARAAAEAFHGELDPGIVAAVAAGVTVPGRLEQVAGQPPVFLDAAHNADGAAALAEALPGLGQGPVVACLAMLADKDVSGALAALAPVLDHAVCTELPPGALTTQGRPGATSCPAEELAGECRAHGLVAEAESALGAALALARDRAAASPNGILIVTGSHYLIAPARAALSR
jgi:dihydrofolate synthase/folylpolyglutamate synthase